MLNLIEKLDTLQPPEQQLLVGFINSVPKIAKQTPAMYIAVVSKEPPPPIPSDLAPYQKAHNENMPNTDTMRKSSIIDIVADYQNDLYILLFNK